MKRLIAIVLCLVMATVLVACGSDDTKVLRVSEGFQTDAIMAIYNSAKEDFERDNPGVTVEFVQQERDLYHTIGLPTLLASDESPDVYFEWAGQRLVDRNTEGYLQPIPELSGEWGNEFFESAYSGSTFDGQRYMVPQSTDITVMIWYNKAMFNELGLQVPNTWDEMMEICEILKQNDIIPFAVGNKGFWVAGNWGAHIVSRIVGEDAYDAALSGRIDFNNADFVKAFDYLQDLGAKGYLNDDMSALTDDEASAVFYAGYAGMHPLGNWMVSDMLENASDVFECDYFNLPAIEGGKGDQTSVIGVTTGYVINAKTELYDEAVAFLKVFMDRTRMLGMLGEGYLPPAPGIITPANADPLMVKMADETLAGTDTVIAPPDTGYNLEIADNFNMTIARAMAGDADSATLLAELDAAVAHLR